MNETPRKPDARPSIRVAAGITSVFVLAVAVSIWVSEGKLNEHIAGAFAFGIPLGILAIFGKWIG